MSTLKCTSCGSTDIETGAHTVCTGCGVVLEDQVIVNEMTFDESPSGHIMASGTFVSSDSTGVASSFNAGLMMGGKESKEITLQNAKRGITRICQKLQLQPSIIDSALNYYRMVLQKNLTRGRKQQINHAACIYIALRHEKSELLLIDLSDVVGVCVHELGRTYMKFAKELCQTLPSMDPLFFIYRFSGQLELGTERDKVSETAMRIVRRMKQDFIHTGRRPSGLCGAALLMAARLHEFNRTPSDIVKIVKIHESTLRKRLLEFGETDSGDLTLEQFMTINVESEADPPSFKASRKKDRERLQKLNVEDMNQELSGLQAEIDRELEKSKKIKSRKHSLSIEESADLFVKEQNLNVLGEIVINDIDESVEGISEQPEKVLETGLGPDIASMGLDRPFYTDEANKDSEKCPFEEMEEGEIDITDIDDAELDNYIMSEKEAEFKSSLWHRVNEKYLKEQQEKEEQRQRDIEEGKPEKKRRRTTKKKKNQTTANSAGEAIEKMLFEKKISTKINYEVLKNLNSEVNAFIDKNQTVEDVEFVAPEANMSPKKGTPKIIDNKIVSSIKIPSRKRKASSSSDECTPVTFCNGMPSPGTPEKEIVEEDEDGDYLDDEAEEEADGEDGEEIGIGHLLRQNDEGDDDNDYDDGSDYGEEYD